jgi:hypothetical protein
VRRVIVPEMLKGLRVEARKIRTGGVEKGFS